MKQTVLRETVRVDANHQYFLRNQTGIIRDTTTLSPAKL